MPTNLAILFILLLHCVTTLSQHISRDELYFWSYVSHFNYGDEYALFEATIGMPEVPTKTFLTPGFDRLSITFEDAYDWRVRPARLELKCHDDESGVQMTDLDETIHIEPTHLSFMTDLGWIPDLDNLEVNGLTCFGKLHFNWIDPCCRSAQGFAEQARCLAKCTAEPQSEERKASLAEGKTCCELPISFMVTFEFSNQGQEEPQTTLISQPQTMYITEPITDLSQSSTNPALLHDHSWRMYLLCTFKEDRSLPCEDNFFHLQVKENPMAATNMQFMVMGFGGLRKVTKVRWSICYVNGEIFPVEVTMYDDTLRFNILYKFAKGWSYYVQCENSWLEWMNSAYHDISLRHETYSFIQLASDDGSLFKVGFLPLLPLNTAATSEMTSLLAPVSTNIHITGFQAPFLLNFSTRIDDPLTTIHPFPPKTGDHLDVVIHGFQPAAAQIIMRISEGPLSWVTPRLSEDSFPTLSIFDDAEENMIVHLLVIFIPADMLPDDTNPPLVSSDNGPFPLQDPVRFGQSDRGVASKEDSQSFVDSIISSIDMTVQDTKAFLYDNINGLFDTPSTHVKVSPHSPNQNITKQLNNNSASTSTAKLSSTNPKSQKLQEDLLQDAQIVWSLHRCLSQSKAIPDYSSDTFDFSKHYQFSSTDPDEICWGFLMAIDLDVYHPITQNPSMDIRVSAIKTFGRIDPLDGSTVHSTSFDNEDSLKDPFNQQIYDDITAEMEALAKTKGVGMSRKPNKKAKTRPSQTGGFQHHHPNSSPHNNPQTTTGLHPQDVYTPQILSQTFQPNQLQTTTGQSKVKSRSSHVNLKPRHADLVTQSFLETSSNTLQSLVGKVHPGQFDSASQIPPNIATQPAQILLQQSIQASQPPPSSLVDEFIQQSQNSNLPPISAGLQIGPITPFLTAQADEEDSKSQPAPNLTQDKSSWYPFTITLENMSSSFSFIHVWIDGWYLRLDPDHKTIASYNCVLTTTKVGDIKQADPDAEFPAPQHVKATPLTDAGGSNPSYFLLRIDGRFDKMSSYKLSCPNTYFILDLSFVDRDASLDENGVLNIPQFVGYLTVISVDDTGGYYNTGSIVDVGTITVPKKNPITSGILATIVVLSVFAVIVTIIIIVECYYQHKYRFSFCLQCCSIVPCLAPCTNCFNERRCCKCLPITCVTHSHSVASGKLAAGPSSSDEVGSDNPTLTSLDQDSPQYVKQIDQ